MQCCQWKNKRLLLSTHSLLGILSNRRGVKVLKKLIPLLDEELKLKGTYEELATLLGYKGKSGAFKAIKILESLGVVTRSSDGYLQLTMEGIILEK